jgi:hypothetical protein
MEGFPDQSAQERFAARFNTFLSPSVRLEEIDNYAPRAMEALSQLTAEVVAEYEGMHHTPSDDPVEREAVAFRHFGLGSTDEALRHIYAKTLRVNKLDQVIATALSVGKVLVPPSDGTFQEGEVSENPQKIRRVPKLKATLFTLSDRFHVDLANPDEFDLVDGPVDGRMVRQTSYVQLAIPSLNRIILSCDELNNKTFVFDKRAVEKILAKQGLKPGELQHLHKTELEALLTENAFVGQTIRFSDRYVDNLNMALVAIELKDGTEPGQVRFSYPLPDMPEHYLTENEMAIAYGIKNHTVSRARKQLGLALGPIVVYKTSSTAAKGYSPDQQKDIYAELKRLKLLAPRVPETYLAKLGIAEQFGVHRHSIDIALGNISKTRLGKVYTYKFGSKSASGYDAWQQNMIYDELKRLNYFNEPMPEDHLTMHAMWQFLNATKYKFTKHEFAKALEAVEPQLGEVGIYTTSTSPRKGYGPLEQNIVHTELVSQRSLKAA